jgi:hypothetical protein
MTTLLGPFAENTILSPTVPIPTAIDPALYQVIYSVPVQNLTPQSVVLINTQCEVSGFFGTHTPGVGRFIVRTDSPTSTSGTLVAPANVTNFVSSEEHQVITMLCVDTNMPAGNYYYNVILYAFSTYAQPGEALTVEPQSGACQVLVFNP